MNNAILKIENLSKKYHSILGETSALKDINLEICEGEFLGIIGPSGCGKSSILNILASLDKDYDGKITYAKENIKIGYMLQEDSLFPWLTVFQNAVIGLKIQKKLNKKNKDYVMNLLNKYGLKDFVNTYPNSLSGGMRQRVALIRTLSTKPDILLLDEPFSALDYQSRLIVSNDVYNILKSEKKTVMIVSHDISEAISMCDKIIVLSKRPGTIKKIYNIHLSNKSNPIDNRKSKEFGSFYDKIWKDLDINV